MIQSSYKLQPSTHPYKGIAIVMVLHLFLAWALISGTASKGLTLLMKPLEAVLIQEVAITPPPPPPQPKTSKPITSKLVASPPPFMPQLEVTAPVTAAAQIQSVSTPSLVAPAIPTVPAPNPVPAAAIHQDIAVVCPVQVAPEMPKRAILDGTQGTIKAQATIQDGVVRAVTILSGPRIYHAAVRSAMMQYKCNNASAEVITTQDFIFRLQ
jgi:protein TonB